MAKGSNDRTALSQMQSKIFRAIRNFIQKEGMPPTVRDIGAIFGLKSSTVFAHLKALEKKGYISRAPGKSRGIQLLDPSSGRKVRVRSGTTGRGTAPGAMARASGIPLLGRVPAGPLDMAIELPDGNIEIDPDFFGEGDLFALKVKGESMVGAGILDGDTVIVTKTDDAIDGQIVVALVEDEATVKRLRRQKGAVLLEPANGHMEPLVYAPGGPEPKIVGRVVGVLRKL
jgi:repressor LexA